MILGRSSDSSHSSEGGEEWDYDTYWQVAVSGNPAAAVTQGKAPSNSAAVSKPSFAEATKTAVKSAHTSPIAKAIGTAAARTGIKVKEKLASHLASLSSQEKQEKLRQMVSLRRAVSKDKYRWIDDKFDLDLTYITPNVIAMGTPGTGVDTLWRNDVAEVAAFFHYYHKDHYMILNLAGTDYSRSVFNNQVVTLSFPDHTTAKVNLLWKAVHMMQSWLSADRRNVVGVHCFAGRGRTGLVVSCFLLTLGIFHRAEDALLFFGQTRSGAGYGVITPSQIRYCKYFNYLYSKSIGMLATEAARAEGVEDTGGYFQQPGAVELPPLPLAMLPVPRAVSDKSSKSKYLATIVIRRGALVVPSPSEDRSHHGSFDSLSWLPVIKVYTLDDPPVRLLSTQGSDESIKTNTYRELRYSRIKGTNDLKLEIDDCKLRGDVQFKVFHKCSNRVEMAKALHRGGYSPPETSFQLARLYPLMCLFRFSFNTNFIDGRTKTLFIPLAHLDSFYSGSATRYCPRVLPERLRVELYFSDEPISFAERHPIYSTLLFGDTSFKDVRKCKRSLRAAAHREQKKLTSGAMGISVDEEDLDICSIIGTARGEESPHFTEASQGDRDSDRELAFGKDPSIIARKPKEKKRSSYDRVPKCEGEKVNGKHQPHHWKQAKAAEHRQKKGQSKAKKAENRQRRRRIHSAHESQRGSILYGVRKASEADFPLPREVVGQQNRSIKSERLHLAPHAFDGRRPIMNRRSNTVEKVSSKSPFKREKAGTRRRSDGDTTTSSSGRSVPDTHALQRSEDTTERLMKKEENALRGSSPLVDVYQYPRHNIPSLNTHSSQRGIYRSYDEGMHQTETTRMQASGSTPTISVIPTPYHTTPASRHAIHHGISPLAVDEDGGKKRHTSVSAPALLDDSLGPLAFKLHTPLMPTKNTANTKQRKTTHT